MIEDIVGFIGGTFILISMIPQAIKSYRTKSVKDISLWTIIFVIVGSIIWLAYGIMIKALPIIIINSIFLVIISSIFIMKLKYD